QGRTRRARAVPRRRRDLSNLEPGAVPWRCPHPRGHERHRPLPARGKGDRRMTRNSSGFPNPRHVPVLVDEVVQALAIARGETLVDGTFGAGGYTLAMLAAGAGRVIGFDRDPDAIANGPSL